MNILFACTAGINRSRAFSSLFPNSDYIGVEGKDKHELDRLATWADRIFVFEEWHVDYFKKYKNKVRLIDLPDIFYYDDELGELRDD